MMLRQILLFVLCLSHFCLSAQSEDYNALYAQYSQLEDSPEKLQLLDSIFVQYWDAIPETQYIILAQDQLNLMRAIGDTTPIQLAKAYHTLGKSNIKQEAYDEAIAYFIKGLDIMEAQNDSLGMGKMYNGIAHCYRWVDKEKSVDYSLLAIKYSEGGPDVEHTGIQYMNLGVTLTELKRYAEAIESYQEAIKILEQIDEPSTLGSIYMNLGGVYHRMGNSNKSLECQEKALTYLSPENNLKMYVMTLQNVAVNYANLEQYNKSIDYTERSLKALEKDPILDREAKAYEILAYVFEMKGDYESALEYQREFSAIRGSIIEERKDAKIAELLTQFETEKKEEQIQRLDAEKQLIELKAQKERQQWFGGTLGLVLVMGFITYLLINNRKQRLLLEEKNQIIEQALQEKETYLKEIHHRVKNNLQVVSSLLNLQARQIEDETALEAIQEGRNRVKSMALIHQNLYQEENIVSVDAKTYIEKLTESLVQSYRIDTAKVKINKEIDAFKLDVDMIIPLGLILNELISNALKYAFKGKESGTLNIRLRNQDLDGIQLTVEDDGIGLPEGFDGKKNRSLGFRLIYSFVKKLKAKIDIQAERGTRISIQIPQPA